jgi:hypothetical protein
MVTVDQTNNLPDAEKDNEKNESEQKGSAFNNFVTAVGDGLSGVASTLSDKVSEVYNDRDKRAQVLTGLKILEESSGYAPITQAKSPLGKIAKGAAEGLKTASVLDIKEKEAEAKKLQAMKNERRYETLGEKAAFEQLKNYNKNYEDFEKTINATNARFDLIKRHARKNKGEIPTGLVENFLTPYQEIASFFVGKDNKFGNIGDKYIKDGKLTFEDSVLFKKELDAASKELIIGMAKNLYPVSENDVNRLLESVGSAQTPGETLIRLASAQKAMADLKMGQKKYVQSDVAEGVDFIGGGMKKAETDVFNELKDDVELNEITRKNYALTDDEKPTAFQLLQTKYQLDLQPIADNFTSETLTAAQQFKKKKEKDEETMKKETEKILEQITN